MRIAVCDDEKAAREAMISCLEDYGVERKIDLDYVSFADYEQLLPRIDEFDAYILDYMTPGMDGLTFAQAVRDRCGSEKPIIFITSYPEIVYDSFKVRAYRFLVKPIRHDDFFEALDSFLFRDPAAKSLTVRVDGETKIIRSDEICCVEAVGRDCVISTAQGDVFCHKNISWFEDELSGCGFFRTHRSYLINLKKIRRFDNVSVELSNGKTADLSARKYRKFCECYLEMK